MGGGGGSLSLYCFVASHVLSLSLSLPNHTHTHTHTTVVQFYIRKTLEQFTRSLHDEATGLNPTTFGTTYYPAQLWHTRKQTRGSDAPEGVPRAHGTFYVDQARLVWTTDMNDPHKVRAGPTTGFKGSSRPPVNPVNDAPRAQNIRTFGSIIKRCQLRRLKIDCTALLVDESQDLNACQVREYITLRR